MIPSRPLTIGEIFAQTFLLVGKTYTRYLPIAILLIFPGVVLATMGVIQISTHAVSIAQHESGFNDDDLLSLRNRFRDRLAEENPAFRAEIQDANEQDTTKNRAIADSIGAQPEHAHLSAVTFITQHYQDLAGEFALFLFGLLLLLIGIMVLTSVQVDLACQSFEERALQLGRAIRDAFRRHFWQLILLLIVYMSASFFQTLMIRGFEYLPQIAAAFLTLFIDAIEIYLLIRFALTVPALVSEELTFWSALKRSWQLTSGPWIWMRVFGIFLIFGFCYFGLWVFITLVSSFFVGAGAIGWWTDFLRSATVSIPAFLSGFISFVTSMSLLFSIPILLLFPLSPVIATVFYYDLRTRRDGPLDYSDAYYSDREIESGPAMWQP